METLVQTKQQLLLTILVSNKAFSEKQAITGKKLAQVLNTSPREINNLARDLRKEGYRVISSKSSYGGYFLTDDINELEHFYNSHESQIKEHRHELEITNKLLNELEKENHSRGLFYATK